MIVALFISIKSAKNGLQEKQSCFILLHTKFCECFFVMKLMIKRNVKSITCIPYEAHFALDICHKRHAFKKLSKKIKLRQPASEILNVDIVFRLPTL